MASRFQIYVLFRREAPSLNKEFLTCFSRGQHAKQLSSLRNPVKKVGNPSVFRSLRHVSARASPVRSDVPVGEPTLSTPLSHLLGGTEQKPGTDQVGERTTKRYFFPKVSTKVVAYWLLGSAASIFGIVVFGGLTRLTESGCVMNLMNSSLLTS